MQRGECRQRFGLLRAVLHFFRITSRRISCSTSGEIQIREGQKHESLIEKGFKMKIFIVYDLDSKLPVAVGEEVSAESARYCASVATGIFHANLFAEEIDLETKLPASPESGTVASA
jgi:hypothetical protein